MSNLDVEHANASHARPTMLRARWLVGRDSEIRDVSEAIASAPLTMLTGPGGVGKTALAMAVAAACTRDFPDGVTVVWLGSLRSAELVAAEVAAQLGLPRSGGQSYEDALTHWLTEHVLPVIDNCRRRHWGRQRALITTALRPSVPPVLPGQAGVPPRGRPNISKWPEPDICSRYSRADLVDRISLIGAFSVAAT